MKYYLLTLIMGLSFPCYSYATGSINPVDTTKAVKLAKKAEKLVSSDKQKKKDKGLELYDQAATMGLMSAQRWLIDYYLSQNPPLTKAALYWQEQLAKEGDAKSQYLLGWIYLGLDDGIEGIDTNLSKGVEYMHMAANQGNPDAQFIYGRCLIDAYGIEENDKEGFDWIMKASNQGLAAAQFFIGTNFYFGKYTDLDYNKAFEYTKKAAEQGVAEAQFNLGYMYHLSEGVKKDLDEAIYWYTKASEQGILGAKNNLALVLEEKNGNSNESLFLIRKAADDGDEVAQYNLGNDYLIGKSVTQDDNMAYHWFRKSAEKDYTPSIRELGLLYLQGRGIDKDEKKGFNYLSKAAERDDTLAINAIGYCYENGLGIDKNEEKAFQCYRKTYDMGFDAAFPSLHRCYYNGIGTEKSYEKAFQEALKATERNIPAANFFVAYAYQYGEGTKKDAQKALTYYKNVINSEIEELGAPEEIWFYMALCYADISDKSSMVEYYKKSAEKGYARAKYNLAICYGNGDGVIANMDKAKALLKECSSQDEDQEVKRLASDILKSIK